jgi:hypothetical protein
MKSLSFRLIILFTLVLLTIFQGCKPAPGTWINDKIEAQQRDKFHALNNTLLGYLQKNDLNGLGNIMSREFLEAPTTRRTVELCSIRMKKSKTELLDEYYMIHATPNDQSIKSFKYETNSYTLSYQPLTREKYIAFFTLEYDNEQWLLTANYNKYKYGWKIDEIELERYTFDNMTAPELYQKAQQEYDKGYLINAEKYMYMARQCSTPCSIWKYDAQDDIDTFYSKVMTEAEKISSPAIVFNNIPTRPSIIRVFIQDRGDGNYPMIWYISKLNLKDTTAVKQEHELMRKALPQRIPGID